MGPDCGDNFTRPSYFVIVYCRIYIWGRAGRWRPMLSGGHMGDLPLVSVLDDSQCDLCRGEACRCVCGPVDSICRSMLSDRKLTVAKSSDR
jgi:hypothetical protein